MYICCNRGNWADKPYDDCMAGVKFILSTYAYLDDSRVAALGMSYGTYDDICMYNEDAIKMTYIRLVFIRCLSGELDEWTYRYIQMFCLS